MSDSRKCCGEKGNREGKARGGGEALLIKGLLKLWRQESLDKGDLEFMW